MSLDHKHEKQKNHEAQSPTNQMLKDETGEKSITQKNYNIKNEGENQNKK